MATACPFVVAAIRRSARRSPARPSMIATILTGRLGSWSPWRSRTSEALELGERHEARYAARWIGELDVQPQRGRRATGVLGEQEFPADRGAIGGGPGGGRPGAAGRADWAG